MSEKKTACASRHYDVTKANLPLCCPMPDMELWNAHPRVYLPIEKTGLAVCSYCGSQFSLVSD